MDEKGRNGRKWHLAQQFTQPVITLFLSHRKDNSNNNKSNTT